MSSPRSTGRRRSSAGIMGHRSGNASSANNSTLRMKDLEEIAMSAAAVRPFLEVLFHDDNHGDEAATRAGGGGDGGGRGGGGGGSAEGDFAAFGAHGAAAAVAAGFGTAALHRPVSAASLAMNGERLHTAAAGVLTSGSTLVDYGAALSRETAKPMRLNFNVSTDDAPLPTRTAPPTRLLFAAPSIYESPAHASVLDHTYRAKLREAFTEAFRREEAEEAGLVEDLMNANPVVALSGIHERYAHREATLAALNTARRIRHRNVLTTTHPASPYTTSGLGLGGGDGHNNNGLVVSGSGGGDLAAGGDWTVSRGVQSVAAGSMGARLRRLEGGEEFGGTTTPPPGPSDTQSPWSAWAGYRSSEAGGGGAGLGSRGHSYDDGSSSQAAASYHDRRNLQRHNNSSGGFGGGGGGHLWDCPPEYISMGSASERYGGSGGGGGGFGASTTSASAHGATMQGATAYAPPEAYNEQNQQARVEAAHVESLMRHLHGVREQQRAVEAARFGADEPRGADGDDGLDFSAFWKPHRSGWDVGVGEGWRPR